MSFDEVVRPLQSARYEGEDTSPTTKRELYGWYSYGIAAEVFAVVAVGKLTWRLYNIDLKQTADDMDRCILTIVTRTTCARTRRVLL
jgi:hypothetical protein